jgi:alanyl-tRNA synthetase
MTHVLNYALEDVLVTKGDGDIANQPVGQKGSLCDVNKLPFNFSWGGTLTTEQLAAIEGIVQGQIKSAIPVQSFITPLEAGQQISSLRVVFGDIYPDPARVVSVSNEDIPTILQNPQHGTSWKKYSTEFCRGTHLSSTSEAKGFFLLKEEGITKGV